MIFKKTRDDDGVDILTVVSENLTDASILTGYVMGVNYFGRLDSINIEQSVVNDKIVLMFKPKSAEYNNFVGVYEMMIKWSVDYMDKMD